MIMKKPKKIYFILGLAILLIIASGILFYRQYDRNEIISGTQEWANRAPFPEDAKIVSIEKKGSAFTREFVIKFTASEEDIQKWLNDSPGTSSISPEANDDIEKYSIEPEGGAQFAEVIYNRTTNEVTIRVYWS